MCIRYVYVKIEKSAKNATERQAWRENSGHVQGTKNKKQA